MGSFWGHMTEGLFFAAVGASWLICGFRQYITEGSRGRRVKPQMSFDVTFKRAVPVETLCKLVYPALGVLTELWDCGFRFQDRDGNVINLVYQQHITIAGVFVIHSFIDLLAWFGLPPIFPSFNYLSGVLSFCWSGVALYYHASIHGKAPVETAIHLLIVYVMFAVAIAMSLEHLWRDGVWTIVVRGYGVLTLGTWFSHLACMLYAWDEFPGGHSSDLDRSDPRNVTYVKAMFGMHLFVNLVITLVLYVIVYAFLKMSKVHISSPKHFQDHRHHPAYLHPSTNGLSRRKPELSTSSDLDSGDILQLLNADDDDLL